VLSAKAAKGLIIVNDFVLAKVSTKAAVGMLAKIGAEGKTLVIADLKNTELVKSLANLADVKLVSAKSVSVYDVMDARNVVVSKDDIKVIEGGLR
jgi:large subunit ribosomal protein L4